MRCELLQWPRVVVLFVVETQVPPSGQTWQAKLIRRVRVAPMFTAVVSGAAFTLKIPVESMTGVKSTL